MTDLDKLIEAVEAGGVTNEHLPDSLVAVWQPIVEALNGSLDAAKRLHDALLPGHPAIIETEGVAQVSWYPKGWNGLSDAEIPGNPARAWLLAILRAVKAQAQL